MKDEKVLVFSIAMNGYQLIYKDYLKTHKNYAEAHGYQYIKVEKPSLSHIGSNCCWLKLTLLLEALEAGYDKVFFIDSDAEIHKKTPSLNHFNDSKYCIYMAKGYSGRYNSGVIIIKNDPRSIKWLKKIISSYQKPIPDEDSVGWGENGHIIFHSKNVDFIKTLDTSWNNTFDPNLNDYIRHYNHGPFRKKIILVIIHKLISRSSNYIIKIKNILRSKNENDLYSLSKKVCNIYPLFSQSKNH